MKEQIWFCKVGGMVHRLPDGSDQPMRTAIQEKFFEVTGNRSEFIFSGWSGELTEGERAVVEDREPIEIVPTPVPMILFCPNGHRHIDEDEFATKVHHTHACQLCGIVWRPAVVPTVGVWFLPGFKNK